MSAMKNIRKCQDFLKVFQGVAFYEFFSSSQFTRLNNELFGVFINAKVQGFKKNHYLRSRSKKNQRLFAELHYLFFKFFLPLISKNSSTFLNLIKNLLLLNRADVIIF